MALTEPASILPQFKTLYESVLWAVTKEATERTNDPARDYDKRCKEAELYDCYFFYEFLNCSVPRIWAADYREELTKSRVTYDVWRKTPQEGISKYEHAENAFKVSAKYSPNFTITKHLYEYIRYAANEGAKLFGIVGHEKAVEELLRGAWEDTEGNTTSSKLKKVAEKQNGTLVSSLMTPEGLDARKPDCVSACFNDLNLEAPPVIEGNIHYYGNQIIQVIGREREKATLRAFLDCDQPFAWFQLAGVAGQGKSRLALDLTVDANKLGWNAGLLEQYEIKKMADHWEQWQPHKPHLIVLDYVVSRLEDIRPCFLGLARRTKTFHSPVRILLLERQRWNQGYSLKTNLRSSTGIKASPELLSYRAEWFCNLAERYDGNDVCISETRFEEGVLELTALPPNTLTKIVEKIVVAHDQGITKNISDEQIKKQLRHIDKEGRPLYAYFLAQELLNGNNTSGWSRDDLLSAALDRERLKWWASIFKDEPPLLDNEMDASRLALMATITGGIDYRETIHANILQTVKGEERRRALMLTGGALGTSSSGPKFIPAMQPDLLGEWYVISSFNAGFRMEALLSTVWHYWPKKMAEFVLKLIQDFDDQTIIKSILEALEHRSINLLAIADIVNEWIVEYRSKKRIIPHQIIDVLQIVANQDHAHSMYQLGLCYIEGQGIEQDTNEAVKLFRKAAEIGDATAKVNLGACYQDGIGVKQDVRKAVALYQEAAEAGDVKAKVNLGFCYEDGIGVKQDAQKAVALYQEAAEAGDVKAKVNLGVCYQDGIGVKQDIHKAIALFREAAKAGDTIAKLALGVCYNVGNGVKQDIQKAVELYQEAAEAGDSTAKFNLGLCYYGGNGVKQDIQKAVELYQEAANAGDTNAKFALGVCYQDGIGVKQDVRKAIALYQEAAEAGDSTAKFNLGLCYYGGDGVKQDIQKAVELYQEAAEAGNTNATFNLGICYYNGIGVKQDIHKGIELYWKAAEAGDANAKFNLGVCYYGGNGVKQDVHKAVKLFREAAKAGNAKAKCHLGICYQDGTGVKKDSNKAVELYRESASEGDASAIFNLCICYYNGIGVKQDSHKAITLLREAAEQGNAAAQNNLGALYSKGEWVPKDHGQAAFWFRKAAEQGNALAQKNLKCLDRELNN